MKRYAALLATCLLAQTAWSAETWRFAFDGQAAAGETAVSADTLYSRDKTYGYEPAAPANAARQPFFFSVALPEGNYRVTATLGGPEPSDTTVKAELRRLMFDRLQLPAHASATRSFIVNIRTPVIAAVPGVEPGAVNLKSPRETVEEAWAWDGRLTLEINGDRPALRRLTIEPVQVPTIFLLGDSTVADQSQEPYASWGQMFTALFKPTVAVSNHAESGETYRDSLARRRIDKILSMLRPGDTVLMQFGHNDQKQQKDGSGNAQTYKAELRTHAERILARGGVPVVLSSMERRNFDVQTGQLKPSLLEYADAARAVATDMKLAFIDLNGMSRQLYAALGAERSQAMHPVNDGRLDNTHHNNYGAMQLARLVAQGLRDAHVPAAGELRDDLGPIDPARPQPPEHFKLAASPGFTHQRPLGD
ncbi:rhamnogalacturonan acetylesterase [Pelomonas cellulosilytica]|uniref:Rhamnogalacturonan acetylesterase n=1 Tax=Pelomonas cellulosilytica TaxID=2906762 RepID=A0ABS8XJF4_9BURK|nr:rhamnogalacturonan acetylesterase [Pelomonas sp. P8]MCE4552984.1 rhamnogalacturonan acetylesterase [Pelomonas sp. P8]